MVTRSNIDRLQMMEIDKGSNMGLLVAEDSHVISSSIIYNHPYNTPCYCIIMFSLMLSENTWSCI